MPFLFHCSEDRIQQMRRSRPNETDETQDVTARTTTLPVSIPLERISFPRIGLPSLSPLPTTPDRPQTPSLNETHDNDDVLILNYEWEEEPGFMEERSTPLYRDVATETMAAPSVEDKATQTQMPLEEAPDLTELCWRCGQTGHRRLQCTGKRILFCSRCGRRGIQSRDCPCNRPVRPSPWIHP